MLQRLTSLHRITLRSKTRKKTKEMGLRIMKVDTTGFNRWSFTFRATDENGMPEDTSGFSRWSFTFRATDENGMPEDTSGFSRWSFTFRVRRPDRDPADY
jgi:hypothetical protein